MRGAIKLLTGLLTISAVILAAGMMVEPIVRIVAEDPAVAEIGLSGMALDMQQVLLQWLPLLFVAFLLVFGVMYALRRGRTTDVRRR
jgi:ethanolamine transporter EutH